nr:MAG TPA: hypothetical protein [Caudoviricetes sp.]DAF76954.1 MAG TPA: hypothetical protein [Caudoviricetes sp.]
MSHLLATKKKRPRYAMDDATIEKFQWLCVQHQKRSGKKLYPKDTLKELIDHEYEIRKSFG